MHRPGIALFALGAALIGGSVLAQGGPPPPDAEPGAVNTGGVPMAALEPAAAPGDRLEVVENTLGAGRLRHPPVPFDGHHRPRPAGRARLRDPAGRGHRHPRRHGRRGVPEPLALDTAVELAPRDCVAFDEFAAHTEHTGWNAADGPTVLWEARPVKTGEPFTTYVNEHGTPHP